MAAGGGQEGKTGGPGEPEDLDKFEPDKGALDWADKMGIEIDHDAKKKKQLVETDEELEMDLKNLRGTSNADGDPLQWARGTGILNDEDKSEDKPQE